MDNQSTVVERAFQLAKLGECDTIEKLKRKLRSEGFSVDQITGAALSKQLRDLMNAAKE